MRIVYIHQYFTTRQGASGTRSYEFARRLVAAGHDVTMITSRAHLGFLVPPRSPLIVRCCYEGIRLVITNVAYDQRMSYPRRVASFLSFAVLSTLWLLTCPRPDIVYATSTPLTVAVPALAARWFRRIPYVFEVRDLWPDVPAALGAIRSRWLLAALRGFERLVYRHAAHIVALSPGMAEAVRQRAGSRVGVSMVPNCCDLDLFGHADGRRLRREHGWEDRFICAHIGVLGRCQDLRVVIEAAARLADMPQVLFLFVGEGSEKPALQQMVRQRGLTNVVFWPAQPKCRVPEIFAAADLCLGVYAPHPVLETSSANKWFDALASGRAVLLNYSGWQRDLLEQYGAGQGCRLGDNEEFIARLRALASDPQRCREMGRNARRLAEQCFSRDAMAARLLETLERVARGAPTGRRPADTGDLVAR